MAGKSKAIGDELYNKCNLELKKHGIRGEIGRRLQAIVSGKRIWNNKSCSNIANY